MTDICLTRIVVTYEQVQTRWANIEVNQTLKVIYRERFDH